MCGETDGGAGKGEVDVKLQIKKEHIDTKDTAVRSTTITCECFEETVTIIVSHTHIDECCEQWGQVRIVVQDEECGTVCVPFVDKWCWPVFECRTKPCLHVVLQCH